VSKLYEICESNNAKCITWDEEGTAFTVHDVDAFCDQLLAKYYSSNNFGSFVRQLNIYGFRKTKKDKSILQFQHTHFQRGREDLLHLVQRKVR
jgi:hypothetical protein